jgi:hypothetical protein
VAANVDMSHSVLVGPRAEVLALLRELIALGGNIDLSRTRVVIAEGEQLLGALREALKTPRKR